MNKIRILASVAVLTVAISSHALAQEPAAPAPTAQGMTAPAPAATAPASAPAAAALGVCGAASATAGKGSIVFFRPWRLSGGAYTYHVVEVAEDGKPAKGAERLVDLPNGGCDVYEAEPGIHSYNITGPMAVNKAEDRLRFEVEPGETYYVEQTVRVGVITGGFRLVPTDEARFVASHVKPKNKDTPPT